jgi:hypothetical protein
MIAPNAPLLTQMLLADALSRAILAISMALLDEESQLVLLGDNDCSQLLGRGLSLILGGWGR